VEILRRRAGESVDLVVTSPPYDDLRTYDGFHFDFPAVAAQLARVLKPGGVIVWIVGDATIKGSETGTSFRQALHFRDVCGLNLHDTMIYEKSGIAFPDHVRYYQAFEFMFVFSKGKPKNFAPIADRVNRTAGQKVTGRCRQRDGSLKRKSGTGNLTKANGRRWNVWRYATGWMKSTADRAAYEHPAIFPEKLAADHIVSWSRAGDVVLDPFLGSGTTGKMALQLGRQFIGCELSSKYFEIARTRIAGVSPPAVAAA